MPRKQTTLFLLALGIVTGWGSLTGCHASSNSAPASAGNSSPAPAVSANVKVATDAPTPELTGGFDGNKAFAHVVKQVGFGPRPSGSQAILRTQEYIESELKSYGCSVDADIFNADTPVGRLPMKNFIVKIPGEKTGIILLGTHYDTKRLDNFVGADDAGSSTALMLELAHLLCKQRGHYAVWIAFFDGEEAVNREWHDPDNCYGSRQMAAQLAISGDLPRVRAFLLADIVGSKALRFRRESNSSKTLTDVIWNTAAKLGYQNIFVNEDSAIEDDHQSFLKRGVSSVDVIDLEIPYWHTPQDTLDKISGKSLAITGHVFLESIKQLQTAR
jgi:glutaminyl-peptide cyclotransferase